MATNPSPRTDVDLQLFLPFTDAGRAIELRAVELKSTYNIGPYEAVDPRVLAAQMGAHIVPASWFVTLPADLRNALLVNYQSDWSAGSITVDGSLFIVANPQHAETRRSVTLLEELVHHGLGHPKSKLIRADGATMRTCQHEVEDEAYAVATALLMPYRELFYHVNSGKPLVDFPVPVPVSTACRLYRVKRAGLWRTYRARGTK